MPGPQALAGVVRPARVPTTPPLLIQGEVCRSLMSLRQMPFQKSHLRRVTQNEPRLLLPQPNHNLFLGCLEHR